jgi:protein-disulfide isomerase
MTELKNTESTEVVVSSEPMTGSVATPPRAERKSRWAAVGTLAIFVAGAVTGGSGYRAYEIHGDRILELYSELRQPKTWSDAEASVPVSSEDPTWGDRDALVTIVQFSDYQCPFCSRVEATIEQVKKAYGPRNVRVVWKDEPLSFHDKAKPAAEAAQGVFALGGRRAFWKFHDLAFKNQSALTRENFEAWAKEAGLNDKQLAQYKEGLDNHTYAAKVEADHKVAEAAGVRGTPAFFINGVLLSGAQPLDKFKKTIDEELEKAKAKIASGTKRDQLYAVISQENKANAPPAKEEKGKEDPKEDTKTVYKVPVAGSPVFGRVDAPVTMVIFSDYECPFCKRVEETVKKIRETYSDKVRIVWKDSPLPFHQNAGPAAQLALEARAQKGDAGFWDAHDRIFASSPALAESDLEKVATDMGLDIGKVRTALKTKKYEKNIAADLALAEEVEASGTPHFFINGRRLVGAQPFEKFQSMIDEEVKHAETLKGQGIAANAVYDKIISTGKSGIDFERKEVAVPAGAPSKGSAQALVTLQVFSDYQCPFCARVEATLSEVQKTYGDKVRVVWRDVPLPFHADAPLAAQAAREAMAQKGPAAYWQMHDKLFANQQTPDGLKRPALEKYATELGLDLNRFKTALDTSAHKAAIDADVKAAEAAGIQGTPATVINGYFLSGAQPLPKFKAAIDKALSDAKAPHAQVVPSGAARGT